MTVILSNADSDVREPVDPYNASLTIFFSKIRYTKVHKATRWTIRHDLMLLCFKNVYECNREVTIHRPTLRHFFDTLVPSSGVTEIFLTKFKEVKLQSFFATPWPVHQVHSLPRPSTVWMNTEIVLQILQVIVCRQPKVIKILCRSKPLFSTKRDIL